MIDEKTESHLRDWIERQEIAERMLPIIGRLYRDRRIVAKVFGRLIINKSPIEILKTHRFARQVIGEDLSVHDTFPILAAFEQLTDVSYLRVDIGKLAKAYKHEGGSTPVLDFLQQELGKLDKNLLPPIPDEPRDIVLYGFGRIGRLLARLFIEKMGGGDKFRLRAIVVRPGGEGDLVKRASLLRRDSVHGLFNGTIAVDQEENAILANGNMIRVLYANSPDEVDYAKHGIENAILIDNTGKWRDEAGLSLHLQSPGVAKVVLTAPGKGDLPNIVYGINHDELTEGNDILSAASCTTNAIVPVLKVVNDEFGIEHGHLESCHSYTNDQNLIDNYHKSARRGRAAALNMVITETGAARAVAKALPELEGKLTGNAIRVPTPNVSLAVLSLGLERGTTVEELNEHLRQESLEGPAQLQIDYSNSPDIVSSDFVGNGHAGIVDAVATIVDGKNCVLYVWYDNEFGYSCQVVRLVERLAGLRMPSFPN